jgi:hypothetical protein
MGVRTDLYADSVATIEAEYDRLGHALGWRFLTTPRRTLSSRSQVAFLTLNPGGKGVNPTHGVGSCEGGSAYVHEVWRGYPPGTQPLQRQVRAMFSWLRLDPDRTLSAYFIPFRSPDYRSLRERDASWQFAVRLWRDIFSEVKPGLLVCIGTKVEAGLRKVWGEPDHRSFHPVGWGSIMATVSDYPTHQVLRLPHLSRFSIFDRDQSIEPLQALRQAVQAALPTRDGTGDPVVRAPRAATVLLPSSRGRSARGRGSTSLAAPTSQRGTQPDRPKGGVGTMLTERSSIVERYSG